MAQELGGDLHRLARVVDVPGDGPNTERDCIATVFEEELWHDRDAERDLAVLTGAPPAR